VKDTVKQISGENIPGRKNSQSKQLKMRVYLLDIFEEDKGGQNGRVERLKKDSTRRGGHREQ
jgi:hypothetical protein